MAGISRRELINQVKEKRSFLCVGLDTDIDKIPVKFKDSNDPVFEFNKQIIDCTKEFCVAYKLNIAFYEAMGERGYRSLYKTANYIPKNILKIADAKRGDIGNTSQKYAEMLYDEFKFDASTLNPYMGKDSIDPFLEYKSKLNFILALTSNPGANDFEKIRLTDNSFLYQEIIKKVKFWNVNDNCGLVFGATKKEELLKDIKLFGELPVLLPGVGAQGGSIEDVVNIFKQNKLSRFLINISRGIIYKSSAEDFADQARTELKTVNKIIRTIMTE